MAEHGFELVFGLRVMSGIQSRIQGESNGGKVRKWWSGGDGVGKVEEES
jgi:hypothetical protein